MPLFGPPGQRIGYTVHQGPPGAPPLLLLHGLTASAASFVSNISGLTQRFTVITAELLGHGQSDAPDDSGPYAPGPAMQRLAGLLDYLGYEQVLLCGHSLGGALALRFALDFPRRLAGLIVINSNSAAGSPEWREGARSYMQDLAARVRAKGIEPLRQTSLYPGRGTRLPEDARQLLTRDFDRLQPAGVAGTAEALVVDVNAFERLGELSVPTLVVIGDRDTDFVRNAPRFLVRLPDNLVDTFTIEGAGHAANLEQPELFNEAVFAFAERIGLIAPLDAPGTSPREASAGGPPDDEDLGPTLYEEVAASLGARSRQLILGVTGAGLVIAGAGMIAAAFLVGGDGNGSQRASAEVPTHTPTSVETAAGVRASPTPGASSTAVAAAQPSQPAPTESATPTAAAAATPTATSRPAPTPTSAATTPPLPEPTPTSTAPPPPATETPAGPWAAINGPSSGSIGQPLTFSATVPPDYLRLDWSASNGQGAAHVPAFTATFASPGCYAVTLTALFDGGIFRTATHSVAIDTDSC